MTAPDGPPVRVALVEDHASLRQALAQVIALTPGMTVAAELATADPTAVEAVTCDVAVVDLDLPGGDGVAVVEALREGPNRAACVVLTGLTDDRELGRAIEAGAVAVLHKSTPMPELLDAIRTAAAGGSVLPAAETSRRLRALAADRERRWQGRVMAEQLTPREQEVLEHLVYGLSNADIGDRLSISTETVQTHVRNLMGKLGASSRLHAVSLGLQHGLVEPP